MKPRTIGFSIKKALKTFPALVLTGPRQSGKTTLLRNLLERTHSYVNLENPDVRFRAAQDPVAFLRHLRLPVMLDEIQYVPELLPYIKFLIDEDRLPGKWALTGSQNFSLMAGVSESLAGRSAVMTLLPFSVGEAFGKGDRDAGLEKWFSRSRSWPEISGSLTLEELLLRGTYPEISSNPRVDRNLWCGSYISTYLERDVRNLSQVGDLRQFEIFLRSCAARTGQILDLSAIARDIGVSSVTARRWLSLLETGHQVFLLYPYYKNVGKRLLKRPKIYFTDTGLASYLMGINDSRVLSSSPYYGQLFETLIVTDFLKRFLNFGLYPPLYYLRTRDGLEVDLVVELSGKLHLVEIKSAMTITPTHAASLIRAGDDLRDIVASSRIVSATPSSFPVGKGVTNVSWRNML